MMWYTVTNPDEIDSPALLIYPKRAKQNIERLIELAGGVDRLRPHVKTHKMAEVAQMHLELGINRFKCATIAEAEMLATAGAADILLAYQPVGPRGDRLVALAGAFPAVAFGCVVDNVPTAEQLAAKAEKAGVVLNVWVDTDNGLARSGIAPGKEALDLYYRLADLTGLEVQGLHVYDGHIRMANLDERRTAGDAAFTAVEELILQIKAAGLGTPNIVVGGSPSFSIHKSRPDVILSPGTFIFWDAGYASICPELPFEWAALVMTRVLSKPGNNRLCLDVGSKGAAPDKALEQRIQFLNLPEAPTFISQNEEHLVIAIENAADYQVGDVLYGVPGHVCTTVNLYEEATVIGPDGRVADKWQVIARRRQINF